MACCTHLRLYLVKTAIQKKRHCGSTLCEIFTSVALLVLFAALYKGEACTRALPSRLPLLTPVCGA